MQQMFDRHLFTVGLDSASLTMLGVIVHRLDEEGEYRGTVYRREGSPEATFTISASRSSAVAQLNIDLSVLLGEKVYAASGDCCSREAKTHFVVNPKGYVVFHVTGGAGGFSVRLRRAIDDPKQKVFDSRELREGDVFSAVVLRPGHYTVSNVLTKTKAAELDVSYPEMGKTGYKPPPPVKVECTASGFVPSSIRVSPGQGVNYHPAVPTRIKIELVEPNDGRSKEAPGRSGWMKSTLPKSDAEAKQKQY
jgi:hypothetical protein